MPAQILAQEIEQIFRDIVEEVFSVPLPEEELFTQIQMNIDRCEETSEKLQMSLPEEQLRREYVLKAVSRIWSLTQGKDTEDVLLGLYQDYYSVVSGEELGQEEGNRIYAWLLTVLYPGNQAEPQQIEMTDSDAEKYVGNSISKACDQYIHLVLEGAKSASLSDSDEIDPAVIEAVDRYYGAVCREVIRQEQDPFKQEFLQRLVDNARGERQGIRAGHLFMLYYHVLTGKQARRRPALEINRRQIEMNRNILRN